MKKQLQYITLLLLLIPFGLSAQKEGRKRDKIIQAKIAFISTKVNLNTDQAEKFWPLYNEFDRERHRLRRQLRKQMKQDISSFTEEEASTFLENIKTKRAKLHQLENDYLEKFGTVLTAKQQASLIQAELEFRRKLEKRIENHR